MFAIELPLGTAPQPVLLAPSPVSSAGRRIGLAEGATGHAVVAAARARFGVTLPALILTGDTDPKFIGSLASQGIAVHFKPLPMDALQGYIQQTIARRPS